jgi:hypothetical protein
LRLPVDFVNESLCMEGGELIWKWFPHVNLLDFVREICSSIFDIEALFLPDYTRLIHLFT